MGIFKNNVVHSVGWYGLWIFEKYFPKAGGGCAGVLDSPAVFEDFVAWNNLRGGEQQKQNLIQPIWRQQYGVANISNLLQLSKCM